MKDVELIKKEHTIHTTIYFLKTSFVIVGNKLLQGFVPIYNRQYEVIDASMLDSKGVKVLGDESSISRVDYIG